MINFTTLCGLSMWINGLQKVKKTICQLAAVCECLVIRNELFTLPALLSLDDVLLIVRHYVALWLTIVSFVVLSFYPSLCVFTCTS